MELWRSNRVLSFLWSRFDKRQLYLVCQSGSWRLEFSHFEKRRLCQHLNQDISDENLQRYLFLLQRD
ncbi:DUF721 domain-containing protein [Lawsonibacter sp. NSJ-52]|uniref:DUF721 domain-containing protein n=1 Tax=Lawsonibacter faecis TaxID=2763052 RepID=A0A8J6M7C4_9FIRM|nr:DUF721 domain-containing protein [Lawsonibacter faecis]